MRSFERGLNVYLLLDLVGCLGCCCKNMWVSAKFLVILSGLNCPRQNENVICLGKVMEIKWYWKSETVVGLNRLEECGRAQF